MLAAKPDRVKRVATGPFGQFERAATVDAVPDDQRANLTFLAPPGEVADWRYVVLCDAAARSGALAALPGSAAEIAERAGLDADAVRIQLDALSAFDVVRRDARGSYELGSAAPTDEEAAVLGHHARVISSWATRVPSALEGELIPGCGPPPDRARWLQALGSNARAAAPGLVDACLARAPGAKSVLELGGGHGEYGREFARRGLAVTMQDTPETADIFRSDLERDGITVFGADIFEAVPPGPYDLAFCAGITHTFGGDRVLGLFRQAASVLAPGGSIAVSTFLRNRRPVSSLFAVQMMLVGSGAGTHAEEDYRGWLASAGFGPVQVDDLPGLETSLLTAPLHGT